MDRNPDEPTRPTNSGKTVYALTDEVLSVLRLFGSRQFDDAVVSFIEQFGSLQQAYEGSRARHCIPLKIPRRSTVFLSPGKHNELQVAVIREFGPRFAPGAKVLYVGDTALKHVICERHELATLNIPITQHDKLPDVLLYMKRNNWLFLIEAATTHGPVGPKRHREIERMLKTCPAERVYVTAFLDVRTFRKYTADIAWETEVWIAAHSDHMIHFNGPKFLGPYEPKR